MNTNPYVRYYLGQQRDHGMPVFRGSAWQMGHEQMGYGFGELFRSFARAVAPLCGSKSLGKIALSTGANVLGTLFLEEIWKSKKRAKK